MVWSAVLMAAVTALPASAPQNGPPLTTPANRQGDSPVGRPRDVTAGPNVQALPPLDAPAVVVSSDQGVISYPASYFAAQGPANASDMIGRLPGFAFNGGSSVRGFDGAAGNVLIDGARPASKTDDLSNILVRVPASQVERIDLIRGGAPGIDMHGYSVVANVVRRKGAATTALVGVSQQWVRSDGRQVPALRLEGSRRENGRLLEGSYVAAGYVDDGAGDGVRRRFDAAGRLISDASDKTEGDGLQHVATAAYEQPVAGGRLRVNGKLFYQRYTFDERATEFGAAPTPEVERDRQNREELELGANYTRDLNGKTRLELLLLQTVKGEDYFTRFDAGEVDVFREQHTGSESIARAVATWKAARRLTVEAGAEGAYNLLFGHSSLRVDGAGVDLPSSKVDVTELRGEAFAKASFTATRKLSVELEMRVEASRIESTGVTPVSKVLVYPKPRLALTWSPTAADQFRVRLERQVGQLNFGDFTASSSFNTGQILGGNPDLNPQQSWVVEAAYERRFWGDGSATLTLRHADLTDVVDRAPLYTAAGGVFDAPANIGDGTKDELIVSASLPMKRWGVEGLLFKPQLSLVRSEVTDPTTGAQRQISGQRPYDFNLAFSHDLARWKMSYGGTIGSGWQERYYRFNQVESDNIRVNAQLFFEYRPGDGLQYRVELRDLGVDFDRRLSIYDGTRTQGALAFAERRNLKIGPILYGRIRKSW